MSGGGAARLLMVCLAAAVGSIRAEAPPPGAGEETVRVEGRRETEPHDPTGAVTVIRVEEQASRVTTIAALLEEAAGLRVRSFGGLGAFATVSIRGTTAEQVNVYLDGVLLNSARGGGVNLADLSLAGVEAIEIYRGYTPAHLPGGAIGGAIQIRTRRAGSSPSASGSLVHGSHSTSEARAESFWTGRRADGGLTLDARGSQGDFRFFDNNGTYFDPSDDATRTRRNNQFWSADLEGRAGLKLASGGRVDLRAGFSRHRQGVPGIDSFQSLDATSETTQETARADLSRGWREGRLSLRIGADYARTHQAFVDRAGDTTGGGAATDTSHLLESTGPAALVRWHPEPRRDLSQFLTLQASARLETARATDRLNPSQPERGRAARWSSTVSFENEMHVAGGRLILSPSARYERFSSHFDAEPGVPAVPAARQDDAGISGRLGAAWLISSTLRARAGAGRFYRVPGFTEIFGDQGNIRGGDDLQPERGVYADLGISWTPPAAAPSGAARPRADRVRVEAGIFRNEAANLIQFVQTSPGRVVARNTGAARVAGAELSAGLRLFGSLSAGIEYTWQVAADRSGSLARRGNDLPGRPRHEGSARLTLQRPWGSPFYTFEYIGPNWFDTAAASLAGVSGLPRDLLRVPGRYLHGAGLVVPMGSRLEATLQVDNIGNVKTADVARFPLPGRMARAMLRVRLP